MPQKIVRSKSTAGGRYQVTKMTAGIKRERDRLVFQILDAVRLLHSKKLLRSDDLIMEQDTVCDDGVFGDESVSPVDIKFYKNHESENYRLSVTLVVRSKDRL